MPTLGVRIKLATEGAGRWAKSGGEKSKFGLSAVRAGQAARPPDRARAEGPAQAGPLPPGQPDHRHPHTSRPGSRRSARYYVEIRGMGFDLTHVDVGGGLGVDYDGSRSTRPASVNYSMQEYANDVVYTLGDALPGARRCRCRNIISESGRALTAHHALLLVNVTDVESQAEADGAAPGDGCHRQCWCELQGEPRVADHRDRLHEVLPRRDLRQGAGPGAVRQRRDHAARRGPTSSSSTWAR